METSNQIQRVDVVAKGCYVKHVVGGPTMYVVNIIGDIAICEWFDKLDHYQHRGFLVERLEVTWNPYLGMWTLPNPNLNPVPFVPFPAQPTWRPDYVPNTGIIGTGDDGYKIVAINSNTNAMSQPDGHFDCVDPGDVHGKQ